ncbi:MAG: hypothetical protein KatS3mg127_0065 [Silanimonas sp.]|nr:MAG: hypothetical protein KatS3mg127_0065 [Silanimonas sp.]
MRPILIAPLLQFAGGLRFRTLFFLTAALFVASLLLPDPLPFLDEVLLGLATLLLSQWKKRKAPEEAIEGGRKMAGRAVIDLPSDRVRRGG